MATGYAATHRNGKRAAERVVVRNFVGVAVALALGACAVSVPDYALSGSTSTGGASSSSSGSTSSTTSSTASTSASSSGGKTCTSDANCSGGAFCWLGACVKLTAVTAGFAHTCATTTAGGVQCWGYNGNGQLGNNSTVTSSVPVAVSDLASGVVSMAAGANHTCALTTGGGAQCWGDNLYGQLRDNSTTDSHVPVAVSGLSSNVMAIAAGRSHTCAVTTGGGVQCWGDNYGGDLGNNSTTQMQSPVPVAVSGLSSGVKAVGAGAAHSCALTTAGTVYCWGTNTWGGLGNNTTTDSPVPVPVSGLVSGVVAITLGRAHTCALTTGGGVQCWGDGTYGALGNNTTTISPVPVPVAGLATDVAGITAGEDLTCALMTAGSVQCWGSAFLGNNSTAQSLVPVAVSGLSGIAAIAGGGAHACALTTAGRVECWGEGTSGQLGNNSLVDGLVPVSVVEP
jgi:alpha-tubulin suppressor-like RCC1 family protein